MERSKIYKGPSYSRWKTESIRGGEGRKGEFISWKRDYVRGTMESTLKPKSKEGAQKDE